MTVIHKTPARSASSSATLTVGRPARVILLFTLPLLIGNIFQQFYTLSDTFIVGHTLGVDALASVGCTAGISFLLVGFSMGMTSGLAIPTAQHFGAGDLSAMRRSVAHGAIFAGVVAVVLTAIAVPSARPLLRLLDTPPELVDSAAAFITVIYWGLGITILFNFLSSTIRALGDSRTPLYFLAGACLLNIALVYLFVGVLHWGVRGASTATIVAQGCSAVACLAFIRARIPDLHLTRKDFAPRWEEFGRLARIALPMAFQSSIIAIGTITLQFALNGLGATAVAAYTAAGRIDAFAVAPLASIGLAMATYVAQNRGAMQWRRIRTGVNQAVLMALAFALFVGVINITLGRQLVQFVIGTNDVGVIGQAHTYLVVNGSLYMILGVLFVVRNSLQGMGHSFVPTLAGFMELTGRVVAATLLAPALGFLGASIANPLAWTCACVPLFIAWARTRADLKARERDYLPAPRATAQVISVPDAAPRPALRPVAALASVGASLPAALAEDLAPERAPMLVSAATAAPGAAAAAAPSAAAVPTPGTAATAVPAPQATATPLLATPPTPDRPEVVPLATARARTPRRAASGAPSMASSSRAAD